MTIKEFFTRKNDILARNFETTQFLAKPENAVEVKQYLLSAKSDTLSCPYCLVFLEDGCEGCPAVNLGSKCSDEGSTYKKLRFDINEGIKFTNSTAKEELEVLVDEYNSDLMEGNGNGVL